jgi:hypothetical protein
MEPDNLKAGAAGLIHEKLTGPARRRASAVIFRP